tara:strand:+ start:2564 stop:2899 length:336 start_codon:yes stop_codon:yes gene_type:complete
MSIYAKGKVLGVITRQQVNPKTGESWDKYYLVLQSPKTGGLAGQFVDSEYQLTKRQLELGAEKRFNELSGQDVFIEIFGNHRTKMNTDRVYSDWYLSGDGTPLRQSVSKAA